MPTGSSTVLVDDLVVRFDEVVLVGGVIELLADA
jgi:hypothetical protein